MPQNTFDEAIAAGYDRDAAHLFEPAVIGPTVDVLASLAGAGRALEFGIGTGRVALPLSARGVPVHGIDISEPMLARLRAKEGAGEIGVTLGDFATTQVDGRFTLVYLVFNTIMNLTTQDEQVACFENAARHLEPGGRFAIEVMIPDLRRLPPGETVRAFSISESHPGFDEYDAAAQILQSHHYWVGDGDVRTSSAPYRYAWPAEYDLMARIAGLELEERWSGWDRAPFTSESRGHVSIWRKP